VVRVGLVLVERPRERLSAAPSGRAVAVEPELRRQPVQAMEHVLRRGPELGAADQRRDAELALADERLRVDHEPRLAFGPQDVPGVEVLVDEHLLTLRGRERPQGLDGGIDELALERPARALPVAREVGRPLLRLVGQRTERRAGRDEEPRQERDRDIEGSLGTDLGERRTRLTSFEQQRASLAVVREQPDRAVPVPRAEGVGLVLALAVWELDLEDGGLSIRRPHAERERRVRVHVRLPRHEPPSLDARLDERRQAREPCAAFRRRIEPCQTRVGELSMWKGCAAGNACRNGIFASLLAQAGLTGPPNAIEGKEGGLWNLMGPFKWEPFGGRGGPFRIGSTNLKYFPSEYYSQAAISAALELRDKVKIDEIDSITVETHRLAWNAIGKEAEKWHPTTRETADHSLPYIVAAALIDGTIEPATFSEERIRDLQLRELIQKVTVRENPEFTAQFPSSLPCRIEVVTRGGESQTTIVTYPRGHAKNPMTDTEVEDKFRRLCIGVLTPQQTGAILESLWTLEKADDVGQVLALFAVPQ